MQQTANNSTTKYKHPPSGFTLWLYKLQTKIFYNAGGPKIMPIRITLNLFKGATFLWVGLLVWYFGKHTIPAYLYLLLHGLYGLAWLAKDLGFGDARFRTQAALGSHLILAVVLLGYWVIPVPLMIGYGLVIPSPFCLGMIAFIYAVGLVLMLGSDYQKNTALQKRKGLITDGFFSRSRNPNYFGQFLIYTSFCMLSGHILGFLIFYGLGGGLFIVNIYLKEELSLKQKEGYEEYSRKSRIFLVKLCENRMVEAVIYMAVGSGVWYIWSRHLSATFWYPFDMFLSQL